ncbi:MAG: response regulator transcription factor [Rhodospirillaceae bacterium]|jgi:CheY-like chemotaxis protein|nr:response regulator transcription factor [Rhodospirillaceae bacterium]MBT4940256.1 response regulator transcription factor [Rhodospirillaceae bacterium]MBT5940940.1 response regulator transcription factor [Rhodospirillaceae bacterium]MBT7265737.1 response regulator transcription factor [Rhodospirillaceae bacterium]
MPEGTKKRILIVEDDEMVRSFVTIHMENHGFEVTGVATGKAFLSEILKAPIDLIILDLNLPDGDGLEFAAEFRKTHNTPIIIASARKGLDDRLTALNLGSIDYVTKPFDPQELYLRIKNLLSLIEHDDESAEIQTTQSLLQGKGIDNLPDGKLKNIAIGATAVVILGAVAVIAWNFGRTAPETVATNTAQSSPPAPVVVPAPVAAPAPKVQPEKKITQTQSAPKPQLQKPAVVAPKKCGEIPKVGWWTNKSHNAIRSYVERKYAGDWKPYIKSWNKRLEKLVDISRRESSAVASSGIVLSGTDLEKYIVDVETRVSVIKCLAEKDGS